MDECARCPHPRGAHADDGECRLNGCGCPGFLRSDDAEAIDNEPGAGTRRIAIDVPDGYMVTITLAPYTADPELAHD